ncbi:hypothetical protein [Nostoc sp. UHCC 0252]|uniref:hypothetical protein n=1 Tax=Nostoc sp. UHCC 0252 TaxID=3110241 RepID=UPI002B21F983|nr:hypothetical protein [Nostoc sp. UHCC 0252]MEA5601075.1 hypothetical protein [Nostoc sp. UHCC 0252]
MVVSQQISPSALRSYKLSKYANGQPGKMLLEAKRIKRVTSQFMSKSGAKEAAKRMKALKGTAANAKKVADATKKATDLSEKIQAALFKNIPGSALLDKASRVGGILGIFSAIGLVLLVKLQEFVTSQAFDDISQIGVDLTKTNTIAINNGLKLKSFDAKMQKIEQELSANAKDFYQLNKQAGTIAKNAADAKKQANDALYETRQGRSILESKVSQSQKQANDALYETRQTKFNLDSKIQQINANIARISSKANDGFQTAISATVSKLQAELASVRASIKPTKPVLQPPPVDTASITANAVSAARTEARVAVSALQGVVAGLSGQLAAALTLGGTAINGVSNLASSVATANSTANAALNEAKKNSGIAPLQQSNLSKEFDKRLADFERLSTMTADERFEEFKRENNKALGIRDLQQSNLSKEFDKRQADFERLSTMTADQRFEEFQRTNRESLGLLKTDLTQTKKEIDANKATITKIDTKLGEQAKVNQEALPKLDQILGILPLIPARAASAIRPSIPTIPQIETAAATGTCRTTQPGGCMNKALKDNAADITNNNNTNSANILDAINTGANAALLTGQQTILARLGDQVPGGISGFLGRGFKWLQLDRVLNVLIFITTVHNAGMLSNNLAQTLLQAIGNGLTLIGIKDENGNALDLNTLLGGAISSVLQGILGAENYATLSAAWTKASRIYQAGANVISSFTSMSDVILNAIEYLAGQSAKVGNALRNFRVVGERAYEVFNPQPNLKWGIFSKLQKGQESADFILQVSQVPIDVIQAGTDFTQSATELTKAIKEDPEVPKGLKIEDAAQTKAKETEVKSASLSLNLSEIDLDSDE